ncbi:hypothetical protein E7U55_15545 [Salmonella enterica]|uniref:hypothetical protein n=1 Tax=Salmonella enterica TaxID=28901 RepID=UPI001282BBE6|nr:hypothetical protein [Salmonella enterica]ECH7901348.1 hypothetical protein [Salmonella enterica subsp. enterica serovar Typhimurium]EDT5328702.1 hypothetical protein [Salmonella enterica subsp. enterica serovar 4,12:i:-]EDW8515044.1 hypothetical protein [Salmonella enterica subsp. enterica]MBD6041914.1 hypothetical protein [Salmonella enterica subsp. enterica serovar Enteritidis]
MTTNNHPAHGPVSLDRLHQISEILSKAAAQSDGGNLGYAMADAVKVIDGAIAAFGAEPVAYMYKDNLHADARFSLDTRFGNWSQEDINEYEITETPLYAAPPAPVSVPTFEEWCERTEQNPVGWVHDAMKEAYDACRAAMLQAGNSPTIPDGYVLVPNRLTAENGAKGELSGEFSETKFINCPECFGEDDCETCDGSGRIEITVPVTWTTIKAIWAKGVEHFAAAPQQEVK